MTAKERYEQVWNKYLNLLNKNPKARLTPFLRTEHIYHRGCRRHRDPLCQNRPVRHTDGEDGDAGSRHLPPPLTGQGRLRIKMKLVGGTGRLIGANYLKVERERE